MSSCDRKEDRFGEKREWENSADSPVLEDPADINDRLIIRLRDLSHIMRSLYEGRGSQKRVLIVLDEMGPEVTQRELTKRLGIQPGSASEVVSKLEAAGYIRRTPEERDRRTARIELTEAGKKLAGEAKQQRVRRHEEMFSCLAEEEKEELLALLETVREDWARRYPGAGSRQGKRRE